MPKIPGTGLVFTANTFLLAEDTAFDVASVTPDGGGALISLRDYLASENITPKPVGNSSYEYASLYTLFSASKLEALRVIIAAEGKPVKGHPETEWDLTDTAQTTWLLNEEQLNEIVYENTIMQNFDDVTFDVRLVSSQNEIHGFTLSDQGCDMIGLPATAAEDLAAEGMHVSRFMVNNNSADTSAVSVRFIVPSHSLHCRTTQKFNEIKVEVDGVKYRLFLDGAPGGSQPQYIRSYTAALHNYFKANVGSEITVGVLGRYGL